MIGGSKRPINEETGCLERCEGIVVKPDDAQTRPFEEAR